jgi:hypothetical protein
MANTIAQSYSFRRQKKNKGLSLGIPSPNTRFYSHREKVFAGISTTVPPSHSTRKTGDYQRRRTDVKSLTHAQLVYSGCFDPKCLIHSSENLPAIFFMSTSLHFHCRNSSFGGVGHSTLTQWFPNAYSGPDNLRRSTLSPPKTICYSRFAYSGTIFSSFPKERMIGGKETLVHRTQTAWQTSTERLLVKLGPRPYFHTHLMVPFPIFLWVFDDIIFSLQFLGYHSSWVTVKSHSVQKRNSG